jgi:flagellar biosynthesis/type III secretory pathway protein FliH
LASHRKKEGKKGGKKEGKKKGRKEAEELVHQFGERVSRENPLLNPIDRTNNERKLNRMMSR